MKKVGVFDYQSGKSQGMVREFSIMYWYEPCSTSPMYLSFSLRKMAYRCHTLKLFILSFNAKYFKEHIIIVVSICAKVLSHYFHNSCLLWVIGERSIPKVIF